MLKEYFWIAIIGVLLNAALIIADAAGFLPLNLTVFILAFLAAFALAWYRPVWVFWLFVMLIPLERVIISSEAIPFSLRPFQFLGVILVGSVVLQWVWAKFLGKKPFRLLRLDFQNIFKWKGKESCYNFKDLLIFAFPLVAFISIVNAPDQAASLKQALVLVSFILLYWLARNFFLREKRLNEALWFFAATSLPILLFGVYQAVAWKFGWQSFQIFAERVNATFTEPDWFGVYLVFLASIVYWLKLQLFKTENDTMIASWELRRAGQWFANLYLFLIFLVLLLTVARSAWAGFAGVTAVYFALLWWQGKIIQAKKLDWKRFFKEGFSLAAVYLLSIAVLFVFNLSQFHFLNRAESSFSGMQKITVSCRPGSQVPQKISCDCRLSQYDCRHIRLEEIKAEKERGREIKEVYRPDPNVEIRKQIYAKTWGAINDYPFLGQGLGSSSKILGTDKHGHGYNASNIFLEVWISTGLVGLVIFGVFFLLPFVFSVRNLLGRQKEHYGLNIFIVISTIALLIPNLFNAGIFLGIFWIWLAILNK
ncbi:MAG: O-antigen ligase family protein [Candidatus Moranbacteria bacterium]|nr:O-antigen ligase family protein [Candidatus Moranbacteria bacterium]